MSGPLHRALPVMNETPLSLLERLRHGNDDNSWQRLSDLYLPLVKGWLNKHGLPRDDADDLTQEIMLVILRELPNFDHSGRTGAFRSWLRTITVHRVRGYWRSMHTLPDQAALDVLDQLEDPGSDMARLWDKQHDELVLGRLMELIEPEFSAAAWHTFHRQSIDGLTVSQTAAELGVSANAVLIAKSRVLRRLRDDHQSNAHTAGHSALRPVSGTHSVRAGGFDSDFHMDERHDCGKRWPTGWHVGE
jgi:RNA polymerase sigma-70 factor, ECF subfamily